MSADFDRHDVKRRLLGGGHERRATAQAGLVDKRGLVGVAELAPEKGPTVVARVRRL